MHNFLFQWADNETQGSPEAGKSQHRSAQVAAYELGSKATSSWTKSVLEIPSEKARVLW